MKTIKGPGIFLAQFLTDEAPFNNFENITRWAGGLGFVGVQVPSWDARVIDLKRAAESKTYCDELKGVAAAAGLEITELSSHLQGQLVASHGAYDVMLAGFAPEEFAQDLKGRQKWAVDQLMLCVKASRNLGLDVLATFSGTLAWPYFYPWPQRPAGLVEEAFKELATRWKPILNACDEAGIDLCYELHPGEDLHDGVTFERFLEAVGGHRRANILYDPSHMVLQQMDYVEFLDFYHDRVKMFHVKDAEYHANGRSGVYGGYQGWLERAGRFRSLGDGQVDFKQIFSKLAQYDYPGWAILEWECCLKHPEDGASEGAKFIREHIIRVTPRAMDDFAGGKHEGQTNRRILGLD